MNLREINKEFGAYSLERSTIPNSLSGDSDTTLNQNVNGYSLVDKNPLDSWAFIRLYYYEYDKFLVFSNFVKTAIKMFSEKSYHGKTYTHAGMNYNLNDYFYGLSPKTLTYNLKVEKMMDFSADNVFHDKHRNNVKSMFTVLGVPIRSYENKKLEYFLKESMTSNKIAYHFGNLMKTAFKGLSTKLRQGKTLASIEKMAEDEQARMEAEVLANIEGGYVCSSFVAYALGMINPELKEYFNQAQKSAHDYTPTTLMTLPNAQILFEGSFGDYFKLRDAFILKNPEFKKFVTDKGK